MAGSRQLGDITTGPDGALWFTEPDANKVGRMTTTGVVTEFDIPTKSAAPGAIIAGPDGALWFSERKAAKVGRIATTGAMSEFPIFKNYPTCAEPAAESSKCVVSRLALGPDGAIWLSIWPSYLGRLTTDGAVFLMSVGYPVGLTWGADGALWFAPYNANGLIRFPPARVQAIGLQAEAVRQLREASNTFQPPQAAQAYARAQQLAGLMAQRYPGSDFAVQAGAIEKFIDSQIAGGRASPCANEDFVDCVIHQVESLSDWASDQIAKGVRLSPDQGQAVSKGQRAEHPTLEELVVADLKARLVTLLVLAGRQDDAKKLFAPVNTVWRQYFESPPSTRFGQSSSPLRLGPYESFLSGYGQESELGSYLAMLSALDRSNEALAVAQAFRTSDDDYVMSLGVIGLVSTLTGHVDVARRVVEMGLRAGAGTDRVPDFAVAQAILGDAEGALASSRRMVDMQRNGNLPGPPTSGEQRSALFLEQQFSVLEQLEAATMMIGTAPDKARALVEHVIDNENAIVDGQIKRYNISPVSIAYYEDIMIRMVLADARLRNMGDLTKLSSDLGGDRLTALMLRNGDTDLVANCNGPFSGFDKTQPSDMSDPRFIVDAALIALVVGQAGHGRDLLLQCIQSIRPPQSNDPSVSLAQAWFGVNTLLLIGNALATERICIAGQCEACATGNCSVLRAPLSNRD